MQIGARQIGPGHEVYVIAEIGVNHDGSVARAMEMVDAAAGAGADAIKLQCFDAELLMSRASRLAAYQADAGELDPRKMLRRLQLPIADLGRIAERAHERGVHAIVTVFSLDLVDAAAKLPWDAFKTASPDIVHRPLLEALAQTGLPMIVSTGAATLEEVERAAGWLKRPNLAFLQCVSSYPTPPELACLGGIGSLADALDTPIGYSDHTPEVDTGALAVACGATILEKHFTHDRTAKGPDHAASLDPAQFASYVRLAKAGQMQPSPDDPRIGPRHKRVLEIEQDVRRVSRQSIVLRRDMLRGEVLRSQDLTFKRPGTGIAPWQLAEVLGRRLRCDMPADMPLTMEALEA